ncbi:MAG: glycosyltransferase [Actinomycetia bacterium]|nr:glycosyltransferase [Actinomycetes bacterium]
MGTSPLVSVIIPVYNAEKYLEDCLNSVLRQPVADIEVICVDDGSTDTSLAILRAFEQQDTRLRVLTQKNQYAGVARNVGLDIAQGEYVHFLDADDWVDQGIYDRTIPLMAEHGLDFLVFAYRRVDMMTGRMIAKGTAYRSLPEYHGLHVGALLDEPEFWVWSNVTPWSKVYRRQFLIQNQLRFPSYIVINDRSFYFASLFCSNRVGALSEPLIYYRCNMDGSLVSRRFANFEVHYDSIRSVLRLSQAFDERIRSLVMEIELSDCLSWFHKAKGAERRRIVGGLFSFLASMDLSILGDLRQYRWFNLYREVIEHCIDISHPAVPVGDSGQGEVDQRLGTPLLDAASAVEPLASEVIECATPLVSVAMAMAGGATGAATRIIDVLGQSLQEIEVICIDCGQPEADRSAVEQLAGRDGRLTLLQMPGASVAAAYNQAIAQSRGEYLYFLDDSYSLHHDALRKLYELADKHAVDTVFFAAAEDFGSVEQQRLLCYLKDHNAVVHDYPLKPWSGDELFALSVRRGDFFGRTSQQISRRQHLLNARLRFSEAVIDSGPLFCFESMLSSQASLLFANALVRRQPKQRDLVFSPGCAQETAFSLITSANALLERVVKHYDPSISTLGACARLTNQWFRVADQALRVHSYYQQPDEAGCEWLFVPYPVLFRPTRLYGKLVSEVYAQIKQQTGLRKELSKVEAKNASLTKQLLAKEQEIECLRKSISFKLGRAITFLPRRAKKILKCR